MLSRYNVCMKKLSRRFILSVLLLFVFVPLPSAAQPRAASQLAVALEGYRNEKSRQEWEEALVFRLRLNSAARAHSGRSVVVLSSRQGRAAVVNEAIRRGCQSLLIWNQSARRAELYTLPGRQSRFIPLAPNLTEMETLELIVRNIEGRQAQDTIRLDIVFVIETGGRMYRLLPDAANFVTDFARTIQTALPVPDARFGLLTFSSGERITCHDFAPSAAAFAEEIRAIRPAASQARLSLDQVLSRLVDSYSWRAGSRRYAIVYLNSQLEAVPHNIGRLRMPEIRLITVPADGANTQTHANLQSMARINGGVSLIPDYLVRYSDARQERRAFYLFQRTLYPLAHDVQEQNWYDIYEDVAASAGTARRFRAGTIDESCEILMRSGVEGIRILEIRSTLARTAALALAGLQRRNENFTFTAPDTLLRLEHNRRTYMVPVARAAFANLSAGGTAWPSGWLGFTPIFEPTREDGFSPHPGTLVLLPVSSAPPLFLQRNWREIAGNADRVQREALFEPGRVFVRADNITIAPITKKRFVMME
jgi:hypothetical protein